MGHSAPANIAMLYCLACSALSTCTAGVGSGATQGHAGGLTLCLVFRPDIPKVNPQVVATGSCKLIGKGILATQHIGNVLPSVP